MKRRLLKLISILNGKNKLVIFSLLPFQHNLSNIIIPLNSVHTSEAVSFD